MTQAGDGCIQSLQHVQKQHDRHEVSKYSQKQQAVPGERTEVYEVPKAIRFKVECDGGKEK